MQSIFKYVGNLFILVFPYTSIAAQFANKLSWDSPLIKHSVFLYASGESRLAVASGVLLFDNQTVLTSGRFVHSLKELLDSNELDVPLARVGHPDVTTVWIPISSAITMKSPEQVMYWSEHIRQFDAFFLDDFALIRLESPFKGNVFPAQIVESDDVLMSAGQKVFGAAMGKTQMRTIGDLLYIDGILAEICHDLPEDIRNRHEDSQKNDSNPSVRNLRVHKNIALMECLTEKGQRADLTVDYGDEGARIYDKTLFELGKPSLIGILQPHFHEAKPGIFNFQVLKPIEESIKRAYEILLESAHPFSAQVNPDSSSEFIVYDFAK